MFEKIRSSIYLILLSIILILFCTVVLWWSFYPYKPDKLDLPYKINTPVVKAGGQVVFTAKICRYSENTTTIKRTLTDGMTYYYAPSYGVLGKGCAKKVVTLEVPEFIPSGTYKILGKSTYNPNPIREITSKYETEEFEVINERL